MFVLERVDTMNDETANRMLKTLEEPASFVHLILLTDSLGQVLETVVSRCQLVRFDPLPRGAHRRARSRARASARRRARGLRAAGARQRRAGALPGLRRRARSCAPTWSASWPRRSRAETASDDEPWRALLERAESAGEAEAEDAAERQRAERDSSWSRRAASAARSSSEMEDAAKRDGRRARTEVLELGLTLAALGFRDLVCLAEGADERRAGRRPRPQLAERARGRDPRRLRQAAERCEDVRESLELNVTEDLALSALGFRLRALVGSAA